MRDLKYTGVRRARLSRRQGRRSSSRPRLTLGGLALGGLSLLAGAQLAAAGDPPNRFSPWLESGFEQADTRLAASAEIYPGGAPGYKHRLDLTLVLLRATSWNEGRVLKHVRKTAQILGPCGIELDRVRLVRARTPGELRRIDIRDPVPGSEIPRNVYRLASMLPPSADWPALFFIDSIAGDDALARSYQRGDVPLDQLKQYPYMNTAWIAYKTHWMERAEAGYSTVAHELGHLLCQCGHERGAERHLLHEFRNFLGARVLPQHCEQFLRSPFLHRAPSP